MVSHDRQSLGYSISTLIQLLQLYKDDNTISVPVLEVSLAQKFWKFKLIRNLKKFFCNQEK